MPRAAGNSAAGQPHGRIDDLAKRLRDLVAADAHEQAPRVEHLLFVVVDPGHALEIRIEHDHRRLADVALDQLVLALARAGRDRNRRR